MNHLAFNHYYAATQDMLNAIVDNREHDTSYNTSTIRKVAPLDFESYKVGVDETAAKVYVII